MSTVLVVDDDPHIVRTLEIMLRGDGHEVVTAASGEEALERLRHRSVDIALVDLQLPGISGTELLRRLRDEHRDVETVIVTAHGSIETAVEAMKEGAFDYLTKPFSPDQVRHRLRQIERVRQLQREVAGLRRRVADLPFEGGFATQSPATLHLLELAREVASSDATVLITGESGTGKTLLARLVHAASTRQQGPFVTVDCTSFQESLLESELFGHMRGAFTGAVSDKAGKVETAEGGTLFLDEVGEVPLHLQGKLLRLVEDRAYERLGDPTPRSVDARILAASNRDLEEMVRDKAFREDLFYRLSVVDLAIPPLRKRPEDILLLARDFVAAYSRSHDRRVTGWEQEVERSLIRYPWPGNVRELAHTLERAVLLCPGRTIRMEHLPTRLAGAQATSETGEELLPLVEIEEQQIRKALALGLPLEETARQLGIDPSTLWRKRKKYGI
ncbi:MAG: sigma-54-dependent Fis family transcriptional regulator [Deltaproteobacteria bacterium]|nr:sigma-54-dependent Fis family transcriptional regulator [Deltaproteobacteria bacterium]